MIGMLFGRSTVSFVGLVTLIGGLAPALSARAEVRTCGFTGTGITCAPPVSCSDDVQCFLRDLGPCVSGGVTSGGSCSPDCNALFTCSVATDCPTFGGVSANCRMTTIGSGTGVCQYQDAGARPFVALCAGTHPPTLAEVRACFNGNSWATGDCDQDGVLNGVDMDPCLPSVTTHIDDVRSPFCLRGHICEGLSAACAPFLRCASDDSCGALAGMMGGAGWECTAAPSGPAVPFCHPICDATVQCSTDSDCGALGMCLITAAGAGLCVSPALAACAGSCPDPLDWSSAQGDCDGDGAENACDALPCSMTGHTACVVDARCSVDAGVSVHDAGSIMTSDASVRIDAGEDAATNVGTDASTRDDGAVEDAASTMADAATARDGGSTAMDASTATTTPGIAFGGGGGCRCSLVGGAARSSGGAWLGLAIGLVLSRRRATRR